MVTREGGLSRVCETIQMGPDKTNGDQNVRLQCPRYSLRTKAFRLSPRQASLFPYPSPAQNVTVEFTLTEKALCRHNLSL